MEKLRNIGIITLACLILLLVVRVVDGDTHRLGTINTGIKAGSN